MSRNREDRFIIYVYNQDGDSWKAVRKESKKILSDHLENCRQYELTPDDVELMNQILENYTLEDGQSEERFKITLRSLKEDLIRNNELKKLGKKIVREEWHNRDNREELERELEKRLLRSTVEVKKTHNKM